MNPDDMAGLEQAAGFTQETDERISETGGLRVQILSVLTEHGESMTGHIGSLTGAGWRATWAELRAMHDDGLVTCRDAMGSTIWKLAKHG